MARKPARGAPISIGAIGDITALAALATEGSASLLCVGVASQILIFDVRTGKQLAKACWEGGVRIHGIRASRLAEGSSVDCRIADGSASSSSTSTSSSTFLLVAHGDRGVKAYLLSVGRDSAVLTETWSRSFGAWTLDAVPFVSEAAARKEEEEGEQLSPVVVAVGAADGSVALHRVPSSPPPPSSSPPPDSLIVESRCAERCLLYSMALLPLTSGEEEEEGENEEEGGVWVAGGSVFLDVLVWKVPRRRSTSSSPSSVLSCPVLFRLSGHEGSIHRVAWAPLVCGGPSPCPPSSSSPPLALPPPPSPPPPPSLLLASASDDRSLRLWSVPRRRRRRGSDEGAVAIPGPVFRGHGSRLWDIVFVSSSSSEAGSGDVDGGGDDFSSSSAFSRSFSPSSSVTSSYPPHFVLSTSEDCSARLWSVLGGGGAAGGDSSFSSVATLRGHRGRGIWRAAAVIPPPSSSSSSSSSSLLPLIATAGADGAVRLWRLSDHVASREEGEEGRLLGSPPPPPLSPLSAPSLSSSPPSSSSAAAARTLFAAGPGVLLVGTGDGAVWRVDLGVGPVERGGGGFESGESGGKSGGRSWARCSWSLVFRAPRGGSVLSLAAVPCGRHGLLAGKGGGGGGKGDLSCAAAAASPSPSSSRFRSPAGNEGKIARETPFLVLAALGRGEAALGCDCARFLAARDGGGGEKCCPPPGNGDVAAAPELRWMAAPGGPEEEEGGGGGGDVPLSRCFLPRELGGDVALTASTLGDLSVWKLPRRGSSSPPRPPPLPPPRLAAAAPPRRARRQRDLAVSCVAACGLRGMLFAGDSAGGVLAYSLPDSLFDDAEEEEEEGGGGGGEEGGGGRAAAAAPPPPPPPVLAVVARTKTPEESAVTCLRLLPLPLPPPPRRSSADSGEGEGEEEQKQQQNRGGSCCCCGELRVGDCAGRATTLRLALNLSPSPLSPLPFSLPAVGAERLPFPLVALDTDHPDPALARRERVVCGFSGDTWIAVSFPRAGASSSAEAEEGEQEEEEGSCFEVARATTGGWRRPFALVPGCEGGSGSGSGSSSSSFLPAVPAALVHCVPSRRGGGGRGGGGSEGGGGELVAREWGSRKVDEQGQGEEEHSSAQQPLLAPVELPAGHGLEVHACCALPSPSAAASAAVLTASEDGSLRWLLVRTAGSSSSGEGGASPAPSLAASGLVRALSDGSALRACACVPTPGSSSSSSSSLSSSNGGDFLVFASGVRAYVTAWRAWWTGGDGKGEERRKSAAPPPLRLRTSWLAASSAGVRSGRAARRASSRSSRAEAVPRALHAAAFEIDLEEECGGGGRQENSGIVAVLVATSLGDVEAVAFDAAAGEFLSQPSASNPQQQPVRLECHEGPALCVSHLRMRRRPAHRADSGGGQGDDDEGGQLGVFKNGLAFSGSTDGGVAVWSGAEIAEALLPPPSPAPPADTVVRPLGLLPALHQSGVNCLAVTDAFLDNWDSRSVLLVTGGDDGALRLTLLSVSPSSAPSSERDGGGGKKRRPEVSVAASAALEGAHSSCALRGAWAGEVVIEKSGGEAKAEILTVGLDQRLRGWAASISRRSGSSSGDGGSGGGGGAGGGEKEREKEKAFSVSLAPLWSVPVQVPAPECLAVLPERGLVSVSGRGTQAFSWK